MKLEEPMIRYTLATLLATAATSIALYLWIIDEISLQRVFGAMLGSELIIFSMLVYVFSKPSLSNSNGNWLLLGCAVAAAFLLISVQLGTQ